ncbi:hypothetical protein D4764_16G0006860 [Takifugu flavidus]|uniref:EGF-like domain-containing protein n=1 Tax=Takifugu flavidus TaxID=433684 RepID=A0A5C6NZS5_9TELE|nr:hypothetical protein D4764_16G0006860 [Takifugu flavidus]
MRDSESKLEKSDLLVSEKAGFVLTVKKTQQVVGGKEVREQTGQLGSRSLGTGVKGRVVAAGGQAHIRSSAGASGGRLPGGSGLGAAGQRAAHRQAPGQPAAPNQSDPQAEQQAQRTETGGAPIPGRLHPLDVWDVWVTQIAGRPNVCGGQQCCSGWALAPGTNRCIKHPVQVGCGKRASVRVGQGSLQPSGPFYILALTQVRLGATLSSAERNPMAGKLTASPPARTVACSRPHTCVCRSGFQGSRCEEVTPEQVYIRDGAGLRRVQPGINVFQRDQQRRRAPENAADATKAQTPRPTTTRQPVHAA